MSIAEQIISKKVGEMEVSGGDAFHCAPSQDGFIENLEDVVSLGQESR